MKEVQEKLAKSLTAETTEIIQYLPYLLQDLWELGSSPNDMIQLIENHIIMHKDTKMLDLACGKGAVSVKMAKHFVCFIKGIDLIKEFIDVAKMKALEHGVCHLCEFLVEDINQSVQKEKGYDLVIFGAAGSILGDVEETLNKLSQTIIKGGYILIDDGYAKEENGSVLTKNQWLKVIERSGFILIEDKVVDEKELDDVLNEQMTVLSTRINELKDKYPDKASIFDQYLHSQLEECKELNNDIIGVTILLQKTSI